MARAVDPEFRQWVDRARAAPIGAFADARNLALKGRVERVGPCPGEGCGGRDRFAINTAKNVFSCRICGARGGPIDLVMLVDRCEFLGAVQTLTGEALPSGEGQGRTPEELAALEKERADALAERERISAAFREDERKRLWQWWERASAPADTPVASYLRLRNLSLPRGPALRYGADVKLYADGRGSAVVHCGPAMLAAICGPDGRFSGLHITWIDLAAPDGKARIPAPDTGEFVPAKKVRGSQQGGTIRLITPTAPRRLTIGEGIETVLSAHDELAEAGRPVADMAFWSAINLGNLGGPHEATVPHPTLKSEKGRVQKVPGPVPSAKGPAITIPDTVEEIVILGDGDSDPFVTHAAIERAARRWARPGRIIRGAMAPAGTDFNNLRRGA